MALLKAFKAVRPVTELASKVAALPYDVMNSQEARSMVEGNPYSFLRIDKAEIELDPSIDIYDEKVYKKAKDNLEEMIKKGVFIKEAEDSLYIYRQRMGDHEQTGLVGCLSIDDYINDKIKKHEKTRQDKEEDRINHVYHCNANTGPIFLTYKAETEVKDIIDAWIKNNNPIYKFIADDEIEHKVWIINGKDKINRLISIFKAIDYLYIADGHHRTASAVEVGLKKRKENPSYKGHEEFNYFLGVLFPDDELKIMDYNRVVKDLNGNTEEDFLRKVSEKFIVEQYEEQTGYKPDRKNNFGMYMRDKWYKLVAKEGIFDPHDPIDALDVSILQNNILAPILGIGDPRVDERIDFIGGIRGIEELKDRVDEGMAVAFSLFPTEMEDIMNIADAGKTMPPKSTWFEPKLRSGLFIHELD